jgi:hypothetical protein
MAVFVGCYAFSPFGVIFVRQGELPEMWRTKTNKGTNGICVESPWLHFGILLRLPY